MSRLTANFEACLIFNLFGEHADIVKESQRKRGESVELVDETLRADQERRDSLKALKTLVPSRKLWARKLLALQTRRKQL